MIEIKNLLAKNVDFDELYSEVFLIFQFDILFINLSLFAFGQYLYWFSRISALLWSGSSVDERAARNKIFV